MPRPFLEKIKDPTYWLEQAAHGWIGYVGGFVSGAIAFAITKSGLYAFIAAVVTSALVGIVREIIQNVGDDDNDVADAVLDTLMTWLGGILTAFPWLVVWGVLR